MRPQIACLNLVQVCLHNMLRRANKEKNLGGKHVGRHKCKRANLEREKERHGILVVLQLRIIVCATIRTGSDKCYAE